MAEHQIASSHFFFLGHHILIMSGSNDKGDVTLPLGVYVPPIIIIATAADSDDTSILCDGSMTTQQQHIGYVRIPDAKGRSICGFSRPIRTITETITVNSKKRGHEFISKNTECPNEQDNDVIDETSTDINIIKQQKRTITEERIHPEEALFLHMRGLLRIEHNNKVMTTQDLFCRMLPECKISLSAYLAYAHLRAQGYILIRYSTERIRLLMTQSLHPRAKDCVNTILSKGENNETNDPGDNTLSESIEKEDRDNNSKLSWRQTKQKLSDDVAAAPPPRVVLFDEWNDNCSNALNTTLAYFAYNPNSNFRRSDPGLPDFGLAIMPFHSSGASSPTFDTISTLVALCENKCINESDEVGTVKTNEIPLRIATVADCGAVIVYGVTRGDVPVIAKDNKEKE